MITDEIDITPVGGWGDDDELYDEDAGGKDDGEIPGEEGMYLFV